jgi:hypothetical protein
MDLSEKLVQAQGAQAQIIEDVKNLDAQINSKKEEYFKYQGIIENLTSLIAEQNENA